VLHSDVLAVSASNSGVLCDCLAHRLGNAADQPERVRRYNSDLTDTEWAIVRPLLPVPAWLNGEGGRPEGYGGLNPLQLRPQLLRPGQRHPLAPLQHSPHRRHPPPPNTPHADTTLRACLPTDGHTPHLGKRDPTFGLGIASHDRQGHVLLVDPRTTTAMMTAAWQS